MSLTDAQRELCETSQHDFADLRALIVNCTLKPSPERSHTQGLIDVCVAIMGSERGRRRPVPGRRSRGTRFVSAVS
jgi:hypothetical protein